MTPGPPEGWDPEEATERLLVVAHAYPEHKAMLTETESGKRVNFCPRCDGGNRDR